MDVNDQSADEKVDAGIATAGHETSNEDPGEFKIEIRKLEVPIRPRGVLAE